MAKWKLAFELLKVFEENGYQAYIVGGAVRDRLLNRDIHDIDIATDALPESTCQLFDRTFPVGIEHGTVLVRFKGESFEVTTFRKESVYKDFRHPDKVEFTDSIVEDLRRRDYTINAIAYSSTREYIDPFDGKADLNHGLIRTVGDPENRFNEDPLRILRGIRFISLLGFTAPLSVLRAMKKNSSYLEHVSMERKWEEMNKLLKGMHLRQALALLQITNTERRLPGFELVPHEKIRKFPFRSLDLSTDAERWAGFILALEMNHARFFCEAWGMSRELKKGVLNLMSYFQGFHREEWTALSLYTAGYDIARSVEKLHSLFNTLGKSNEQVNLKKLESIWGDLPIHSRQELAVKGDDLLEWTGYNPGPWVGELLTEIETEIVNHKLLNNKPEIRKRVKKCLQQKFKS
jgi:tRNA nucleotidyltransferase (CCA-adding enzyme)